MYFDYIPWKPFLSFLSSSPGWFSMAFNRFPTVFKLSRTEFVKQNQMKVNEEKHSKNRNQQYFQSKDSQTYKLAYFVHSTSIMHMLFQPVYKHIIDLIYPKSGSLLHTLHLTLLKFFLPSQSTEQEQIKYFFVFRSFSRRGVVLI